MEEIKLGSWGKVLLFYFHADFQIAKHGLLFEDHMICEFVEN